MLTFFAGVLIELHLFSGTLLTQLMAARVGVDRDCHELGTSTAVQNFLHICHELFKQVELGLVLSKKSCFGISIANLEYKTYGSMPGSFSPLAQPNLVSIVQGLGLCVCDSLIIDVHMIFAVTDDSE